MDTLRKFLAPELVFGVGASSLVARYVQNLGGRHALVVTDAGVAGAGWSAKVISNLEGAGIILRRPRRRWPFRLFVETASLKLGEGNNVGHLLPFRLFVETASLKRVVDEINVKAYVPRVPSLR